MMGGLDAADGRWMIGAGVSVDTGRRGFACIGGRGACLVSSLICTGALMRSWRGAIFVSSMEGICAEPAMPSTRPSSAPRVKAIMSMTNISPAAPARSYPATRGACVSASPSTSEPSPATASVASAFIEHRLFTPQTYHPIETADHRRKTVTIPTTACRGFIRAKLNMPPTLTFVLRSVSLYAWLTMVVYQNNYLVFVMYVWLRDAIDTARK